MVAVSDSSQPHRRPLRASRSSLAYATDDLTVTSVARDYLSSGGTGTQQEPAAQAVLTWGPPMGPGYAVGTFAFRSGTTAGQAGVAFGYRAWPNYWNQVLDLDGQQKLNQVGTANTQVTSGAWAGISAGTSQPLFIAASRLQDFTISTYLFGTGGSAGYPGGSVGLFTNVAGTKFGPVSVYDDADTRDLAGRWTDSAPNLGDGYNAVSPNSAGSRLRLSSNGYGNYRPTWLRNLRLAKFQMTFSLKRESGAGSSNYVDVCFNTTDQDDYDYLKVSHSNSAIAPSGFVTNDGIGGSPVSGQTQATSAVPTTGSSDILWVQVTANGTNVTVKEQVNDSGTPTASSWSSVSACCTATGFRTDGGQLGFKSETSAVSVGSVTINSYDTATSAFDITEAYEPFTVGTTTGTSTYGFASDTPTSDANGNLTYDGSQVYSYDAWSRLKNVSHGYRDGSGHLQQGQALARMVYDGLGRRISKIVTDTGGWDCTYNYYLDRDSAVEERNGSNQTIKQMVWGMRYVDELVQTSINSNPTGQSTCDVPYWARRDANWNVMGVVPPRGVGQILAREGGSILGAR